MDPARDVRPRRPPIFALDPALRSVTARSDSSGEWVTRRSGHWSPPRLRSPLVELVEVQLRLLADAGKALADRAVVGVPELFRDVGELGQA